MVPHEKDTYSFYGKVPWGKKYSVLLSPLRFYIDKNACEFQDRKSFLYTLLRFFIF